MKHIGTSLVAAALFLSTASTALAADGTLTIKGKITAQTCTVNGNGGGKDFTVTLPTIPTSALSIANPTAGRTPFNIALSACMPNAGNVFVYFEPSNTTTENGQLGNIITDATGARGVRVMLLNSDLTQIHLKAGQDTQNSRPVALSNGAATLNYFAQYAHNGGAIGPTAGDLRAVTQYSIVYQ
ncbi:TPA: type 1 fimbrial protein [Pseudomonas aeruginosa]|nr:type 1 fimbrial protein [Pseudomonas aeruginosa]HEH8432041.1 type 1 fimbrial protein [Pseudomonas aeruginosa]HEH8533592.1 type 1 fimbrial protein [Pseudomonas aeruginosa]HEH8759619.1 type 1 fimbrial protein [Pseudomonas aeruginosa]